MRMENLKPFCNILINEELKLYMLLTDDEIGDGDTYVLADLQNDGWEEFCSTQRGHKKATLFMEKFYPEYKKFSYEHKQYPLKEISKFIDDNHRHHLSPQGCNFAFGVKLGDKFIGVITAGRPVAAALDNGSTLEITRVCVKKGYKNLCSYLYSHMVKIAKDMNYQRVITYTLESEPGTSCVAAGFKLAYKSKGGEWSCKTRPRHTKAPTCPKNMWEHVIAG